DGAILAVAFRDDRTLLTAGLDRTIRTWDYDTGRETGRFTGHVAPVSALAVSPDGRTLVSGSWDTSLRLWDLESDRQLHLLLGHRATMKDVKFTPDGRFVV